MISAGVALCVLFVVVDDECVVVLPPSEYVRPVHQVVADHRQTVPPRFNDGLHVMQAAISAGVKRLQTL